MSANISFEQDAKLVSHLLTVLSGEQANLIHADIDAIEALVEEKAEILQAINLVIHARYAALAKAGFEPNEEGMVAWIKQHNKPALNQAWADFQKTLSQAKEMNRLNGMMINKHFNRNQQFLTQLKGNYANGGVYGPNGQATSQAYTRAALLA